VISREWKVMVRDPRAAPPLESDWIIVARFSVVYGNGMFLGPWIWVITAMACFLVLGYGCKRKIERASGCIQETPLTYPSSGFQDLCGLGNGRVS